MTVKEAEPAKDVEKLWPESEVENQENVVSWSPKKDYFKLEERAYCIKCC